MVRLKAEALNFSKILILIRNFYRRNFYENVNNSQNSHFQVICMASDGPNRCLWLYATHPIEHFSRSPASKKHKSTSIEVISSLQSRYQNFRKKCVGFSPEKPSKRNILRPGKSQNSKTSIKAMEVSF